MAVVDVFSRFIRVEPMRNKNAETAKRAFLRLCSKQRDVMVHPRKLWVDRGKEFHEYSNSIVKILEQKYTTLTVKPRLPTLREQFDP